MCASSLIYLFYVDIGINASERRWTVYFLSLGSPEELGVLKHGKVDGKVRREGGADEVYTPN